MISRHFAALAISLSVTLAACGGGDSEEPAPPTEKPAAIKPTKLLVVGNSLTRHGPAPAIGWSGDHGMAASSADKDFAHLTAAALGVPVEAFNYFKLEHQGDASEIPTYAAMVTPTTVVVVQMGENMIDPLLSIPPYKKLLEAMKPAQKVVCTGSWWTVPAMEANIKTACQSAGGVYVYIGDLYAHPDNTDKKDTPFAHEGVNNHPHDWGMARIAERVTAALK